MDVLRRRFCYLPTVLKISKEVETMTPRDRLQRLLFEHRTAHDPASSEREIVAMFESISSELLDVLEWARIEKAPLREQEINSIERAIFGHRQTNARTAHTKEQA
jgi:hypothetical protein